MVSVAAALRRRRRARHGLLRLAANTVGPFLRFFIVFYGLGFIALTAVLALQPFLPGEIKGFLPPPLATFTAAAFSILAFALGRVPVMRQITAITDPYFTTDERQTFAAIPGRPFTFPVKWMAMALLAIIILINLAQVWISVSLSFFNRDWFDAIQAKNGAEFWRLLFAVWVPLVAILIGSNFIEFLIVSAFKMRWRTWLTTRSSAAGSTTGRITGCSSAIPASTTPTSASPRTSGNTSTRPIR